MILVSHKKTGTLLKNMVKRRMEQIIRIFQEISVISR